MTIRSEQEILDLIGDPREIVEQLRAFEADQRALWDMHAELMRQYPREWVAVLGGRLVGHAPDLDALLAEADRSGLKRGSLAVEYLDPDEFPLAL